jgi:Spy/CpxP family protein refolding chaperone
MFGGGGGAVPYESMLMMRMGQGGASIRGDIAKELGLTSEQETKLKDLQAEQMEKMMSSFRPQGGNPPDQAEREKMMKQIGDMLKEADKKALAVLDEKQKKRLHELWIQRQGNGAILNETVQKELALTDDQKTKIKNLQTRSQDANRTLGEKMRNQEIDFQEFRDASEKNRKIMNDELGKVLTKDQADKLKAMGGAEFKFEDGN